MTSLSEKRALSDRSKSRSAEANSPDAAVRAIAIRSAREQGRAGRLRIPASRFLKEVHAQCGLDPRPTPPARRDRAAVPKPVLREDWQHWRTRSAIRCLPFPSIPKAEC